MEQGNSQGTSPIRNLFLILVVVVWLIILKIKVITDTKFRVENKHEMGIYRGSEIHGLEESRVLQRETGRSLGVFETEQNTWFGKRLVEFVYDVKNVNVSFFRPAKNRGFGVKWERTFSRFCRKLKNKYQLAESS